MAALVFLGVAAAHLGLAWAEPLATVLLGIVVLRMGIASVTEGFDVLMDRVADPDLRGRLKRVASGVEGVRGIQGVRVHPLGSSYAVEVEISVDGRLTVDRGHSIAHDVEEALLTAQEHVEDVLVHVNPWSAKDSTAVPVEGPLPGPDA